MCLQSSDELCARHSGPALTCLRRRAAPGQKNNTTKSLTPAERLHAAVRVLRERFISLAVVSEVQVVFEDPGPERRLRGGNTHKLQRDEQSNAQWDLWPPTEGFTLTQLASEQRRLQSPFPTGLKTHLNPLTIGSEPAGYVSGKAAQVT